MKHDTATQDPQLNRAPLYTCKVTLREVAPVVWRRVFCPADASIEWLSALILETLGWESSGQFEFLIEGNRYEVKGATLDAAEVTLSDAGLKSGTRFEYRSDTNTKWHFEIEVESICQARPMEPEFGCRAGEMASPFEECGGPEAYKEILDARNNVTHPRYKEFDEQYQLADFDPGYFDIAEVNERIQIELMMDDDAYEMLHDIVEQDQKELESPHASKQSKPENSQEDKISLLLSVALTNQLMADDPKEVLATTERLIESGLSENDAFGEVLAVFSEEFFDSHSEEREFDLATYIENLNALV